jgi:single-strand DNA-binding protein
MRILDNHVHLVGFIVTEPAVIMLKDGMKMARFSIATKAYAKNEAGKIETRKEWHRLVASGRFATIVEQFAEKGTRIAIEGKLCSRFYRTKDGQNRYANEVELSDIVFLNRNEQFDDLAKSA